MSEFKISDPLEESNTSWVFKNDHSLSRMQSMGKKIAVFGFDCPEAGGWLIEDTFPFHWTFCPFCGDMINKNPGKPPKRKDS